MSDRGKAMGHSLIEDRLYKIIDSPNEKVKQRMIDELLSNYGNRY